MEGKPAAGDRELAALRVAIRRAGRSAQQFWLALIAALGMIFHALVLGPHFAEAIARDGFAGAVLGAAGLFIFMGPGWFALSMLPAYLFVLLYRKHCAARLRKHLAPLSPEQRGRVLHPLEDDALAGAREIAHLLVREFRATEVSPAISLGRGRGTEPAAISP